MAQEIGESRTAWGLDVMKMAEDFANHMKGDVKPFYIVYCCKEDKGATQNLGRPAFRQSMTAYREKPPAILGILVWYVNHPTGEFRFVPELSAPFDVPLDPRLLSDKAYDASERVAAQGQKLRALVS
jgi:hypothetical protein